MLYPMNERASNAMKTFQPGGRGMPLPYKRLGMRDSAHGPFTS